MKLVMASELPMQRSREALARLASLFQGLGMAVDRPMPGLNANPEVTIGAMRDAFNSGCVVGSAPFVEGVLRGVARPQIADSIVQWVAVDMVDQFRRFLRVVEEPSETMPHDDAAAHCNADITTLLKSNRFPISGEQTSFRVVGDVSLRVDQQRHNRSGRAAPFRYLPGGPQACRSLDIHDKGRRDADCFRDFGGARAIVGQAANQITAHREGRLKSAVFSPQKAREASRDAKSGSDFIVADPGAHEASDKAPDIHMIEMSKPGTLPRQYVFRNLADPRRTRFCAKRNVFDEGSGSSHGASNLDLLRRNSGAFHAHTSKRRMAKNAAGLAAKISMKR
jgi:hypothetical protein